MQQWGTANPFADAYDLAREAAARAGPFLAVVLDVESPLVEISSIAAAQISLGWAATTPEVIAGASVGDRVVAIPLDGGYFVLALKA